MAEETVSRYSIVDFARSWTLYRPNPLVTIDPATHFVKAVGVDPKSEFNRATQALRQQPGSAFKYVITTTQLFASEMRVYAKLDCITTLCKDIRDGNSYYYPKNYDSSFLWGDVLR